MAIPRQGGPRGSGETPGWVRRELANHGGTGYNTKSCWRQGPPMKWVARTKAQNWQRGWGVKLDEGQTKRRTLGGKWEIYAHCFKGILQAGRRPPQTCTSTGDGESSTLAKPGRPTTNLSKGGDRGKKNKLAAGGPRLDRAASSRSASLQFMTFKFWKTWWHYGNCKPAT